MTLPASSTAGVPRQLPEHGRGRRRPGGAATRGAVTRLRGAIAAFALFVAAAGLVQGRWTPLITFDGAVDLATHDFVVTHRGLLPALELISTLGSPPAMDAVVLVGAVVLLVVRRARPAAYLVVSRLLELAVETTTKDLLGRPRPTWTDPVASATSSSFPSGHSAGTAVVYCALVLLGVIAVGWPCRAAARAAVRAGVLGGAILLLAVPVSRVLLGVHYPSDVVGGVLLGLACALAASPILAAAAVRPSPAA